MAWNPFLFFNILGIIIPTDFHIFQRGGSTTNQVIIVGEFPWGSAAAHSDGPLPAPILELLAPLGPAETRAAAWRWTSWTSWTLWTFGFGMFWVHAQPRTRMSPPEEWSAPISVMLGAETCRCWQAIRRILETWNRWWFAMWGFHSWGYPLNHPLNGFSIINHLFWVPRPPSMETPMRSLQTWNITAMADGISKALGVLPCKNGAVLWRHNVSGKPWTTRWAADGMIWGFPSMGIPRVDGLLWETLLKWLIWGYPYFRKPSYGRMTSWDEGLTNRSFTWEVFELYLYHWSILTISRPIIFLTTAGRTLLIFVVRGIGCFIRLLSCPERMASFSGTGLQNITAETRMSYMIIWYTMAYAYYV